MNKKNKVGIMTLHNSYNYGAVLQAYATYYFIKSIGFNNVEIINYENKYEKQSKQPLKFILNGNNKLKLKRAVQYIIFGKNRHLKKGFLTFNNSLRKGRKIDSFNDLLMTDYDLLISGSDQIWNPVIFNEIDKAFFLDFSSKAKKISISSSAGSYIYSEEEIEKIENMLGKYDAISVREESLKQQLQKKIKQDIFVSVDPTLLLSMNEWKENLKSYNKYNEQENDYILLYLVDANLKDYEKEIEELKKRICLPIWMITPYKFKLKNIDKNIVSSTPEDFISLIENSRYVITNSYHGVIFSTNFSKKYVALENHKNPKRTYDFLNSIGLRDRIVKNEQEARKINLDYQYEEARVKMKEIVDKTKEWIISNVNK